jgi:NADH:ubiquinone oxidoreductase subunit 6 (subunit J)
VYARAFDCAIIADVRILFAVVFLLGAVVCVFAGAVMLFAVDRSEAPSPFAALLSILFLVALGVALAYAGLRLVLIRKQADQLLSPREGRVAGACAAAIGAALAAGGLFEANLDYGVVGLFAFLAGYWIFKSAKARPSS